MKLNKILGKPIYFIDRNKAFRICKATSIHGNTITVTDAVGGKERLHPETNHIFGVVVKSLVPGCTTYEPIEFGIIRIGKRIKNKKIQKGIDAMTVKPLRTKKPNRGRPRKVK
jgi:hypothetical protein